MQTRMLMSRRVVMLRLKRSTPSRRRLSHCRGTGVPHSRHVAAPRCTGFLHRGQIRNPASNFTAEAGGVTGGTKPISISASSREAMEWIPVDVETGDAARSRLAACCDSHALSRARSAASSSSVRASVSDCEACPAGAAVLVLRAEVGTGTTRPQSGHLPATGLSTAGTFNRRPHGQRNRKNPSPVSPPGEAQGIGAAGSLLRTWGSQFARGRPLVHLVFHRNGRSPEAYEKAWRLMVHDAKN